MVQLLSTLFNCTLSSRAGKKMTSSSNKVDLTSSSCGVTESFAAYSKKGKKGLNNQDCIIVWEEEFGCCEEEEEMFFCGVFDGHGPWGHLASKTVGQLMPKLLLANWQELNRQVLVDNESCCNHKDLLLDMWKKCYYKTCAAVDQQLHHHPRIDSFHSGTTALALVRQGDLMIVANVGDSRAVLATTSPDDDANLVATQLTTDFKPNLPHERERISGSGGTIYCCPDEPGVHRVWRPNGRGEGIKGPGLAVSRAFGDFFIKDFGLVSDPQITHRLICSRDQFVILATDGVWDVMSNEEAVDAVNSGERAESAKRVVQRAACAWKHRGRANVMDDISVICLFFH